MNVIFELSGTTLYETDMDCVPQIGSTVQIKTITYKKGLPADSIIEFEVGAVDPLCYALSDEGHSVVISVNGYREIHRGPEPSDD